MKTLITTLHRYRIIARYVSILTILVTLIARAILPSGSVHDAFIHPLRAAVIVFVLSVIVSFGARRYLPTTEPINVKSPVSGRWYAVNSPTSAVPSHGIHAYGQGHAIDLVHDPLDATRPDEGKGAMFPAEKFPAFGEPIYAMVSGVVVTATDTQRDHKSRSNGLALLYMMLPEANLRELLGPRFLVGNHVTIRTEEGIYALMAHVRRGSLTVRVGQHVTAGEVIGQCGNSGNSSEPHVHAQLMDRRSLWTARGVAMNFHQIHIGEDSGPGDGLPANEEHMVAAIDASVQ